MMFTTTISVNNIYNTSNVIVPIIWLYITVVVVMISLRPHYEQLRASGMV